MTSRLRAVFAACAVVAAASTVGCRVNGDGPPSNVGPETGGPTLLHDHSEGRAYNIFVDPSFVYWSSTNDNLSIRRMKKDRGPIENVGPWSGEGHPDLFAQDADAVYWLSGSQIQRLARATNALTSLQLDASYDYGSLGGDADALYVASAGCLKFVRVPKSGQALQHVELPSQATGGVTNVEIDDRYLYCSNEHHLLRAPKALDGPIETIAEVPGAVWGLAQDAKRLFFTENTIDGIYYLKAWSKADGAVVELDHESGASAGALRADPQGTSLYFHHKAQTRIVAFDLARSERATLVDNRSRIGDLAIDDAFVYWSEEHAILKVGRPK